MGEEKWPGSEKEEETTSRAHGTQSRGKKRVTTGEGYRGVMPGFFVFCFFCLILPTYRDYKSRALMEKLKPLITLNLYLKQLWISINILAGVHILPFIDFIYLYLKDVQYLLGQN